jgi:hypothetical protein
VEIPPLQRDSIAFAGVLLDFVDRRDDDPRVFPALRDRLAAAALTTVEQIVLALRSDDPCPHLCAADDALAVVRLHLTLADGLGLLSQEMYLAFMDQADCIGRQIGALLRSMAPGALRQPAKPRPRSSSRSLSSARARDTHRVGAPK